LKKYQIKNVHRFLLFSSQSFMEVPKSLMTKKIKKNKKSKEDEKILAGLS